MKGQIEYSEITKLPFGGMIFLHKVNTECNEGEYVIHHPTELYNNSKLKDDCFYLLKAEEQIVHFTDKSTLTTALVYRKTAEEVYAILIEVRKIEGGTVYKPCLIHIQDCMFIENYKERIKEIMPYKIKNRELVLLTLGRIKMRIL